MVLPGIPKPKRNVTSVGSGARKKDSNRYINVSRVMRESICSYNSKLGDHEEKYKPFPDDQRSDSHRNRNAFQVVEDVLEKRLLYKNENNETVSYYGTHTSPELPPNLLNKMIDILSARPELHVYTQAQNNWAIKKLIEQKMCSKAKRHRQARRKQHAQELCQSQTANDHSVVAGGDEGIRTSVEDNARLENDEQIPEKHPNLRDVAQLKASAAMRAQQAFEIAQNASPQNASSYANVLPINLEVSLETPEPPREDDTDAHMTFERNIRNRQSNDCSYSDSDDQASPSVDDHDIQSEEERILQLELRLARLRMKKKATTRSPQTPSSTFNGLSRSAEGFKPSNRTPLRREQRLRAPFKAPRNTNKFSKRT